MFCLVDWGNMGKWVALGGSGFTHSENKVGKLVKTSGTSFVGRYQVMEVIYSSGNLFWHMFWSGLFQYNCFQGSSGEEQDSSWLEHRTPVLSWLDSCTSPTWRAKIYFHSLFVCALNSSPVQHLMPGIALAFSGKLEPPQHHRTPRVPKPPRIPAWMPWYALVCPAWLLSLIDW